MSADNSNDVVLSRRKLITGAAAVGAGAAMLASSDATAHGSPAGRVANVRDAIWGGPNNGAVGDGIADDTIPIRAALSSTLHDVIYFPAGTYLIKGNSVSNACLERANQTLIIVGDGPQASQIVWDPQGGDDVTSHLIKWSTTSTNTDDYDRLEVRGLTLRAGRNLNTAIHATKAAVVNGGRLQNNALIENVEIVFTASNAAFKRAIYLEGLEHSRLRSITCQGNNAAATVGIELTSVVVGSPPEHYKATDFHLHHVTLVNFETGVLVGGELEGVMLTDSVIMGGKTGVACNLLIDALPGLYIRGCHIMATVSGIQMGNFSQAIICDNLIYVDRNTENVYVGINAGTFNASAADKDMVIRGNILVNSHDPNKLNRPSPLSYGILVPASSGVESVLISENRFVAWYIPIHLNPGSNGAFVSHSNTYRATSWSGGNVYNGGSNTVQP